MEVGAMDVETVKAIAQDAVTPSYYVWLQVIVGGLLGGGALVKIIEKIFGRYFVRRDSKVKITETNQEKAIDADIESFKIVAERLKIVDGRLDIMQENLTTALVATAIAKGKYETLEKEYAVLAVKHENTEKENVAQQTEIVAQKAEIVKLREDRRNADKVIADLRREVDVLTLRFDHAADQPIDVRLVDDEGNGK